MQDISSILFSGVIESSDVLITGVRGTARRLSFLVGSRLSDALGRMHKRFLPPRSDSPASLHEVEIVYSGRTGVSLKMTSERMVLPAGSYTLGQLLCSLYKRGDRWVDELDDSQLMCTVNGREAGLFDTIAPGAEICLSSTRALFRQ
jgi:hypothetical protein